MVSSRRHEEQKLYNDGEVKDGEAPAASVIFASRSVLYRAEELENVEKAIAVLEEAEISQRHLFPNLPPEPVVNQSFGPVEA